MIYICLSALHGSTAAFVGHPNKLVKANQSRHSLARNNDSSTLTLQVSMVLPAY